MPKRPMTPAPDPGSGYTYCVSHVATQPHRVPVAICNTYSNIIHDEGAHAHCWGCDEWIPAISEDDDMFVCPSCGSLLITTDLSRCPSCRTALPGKEATDA